METVRFTRPARIDLRLVRDPVPHVTETFELHQIGTHTRLTCTGELGTDLWALGQQWATVVSRR